MKFDYVIGNPPYQDETLGDNGTFAPPVYNKFLDASYEIAEKVEMVHPARFLFNAGSTPKAWNEKMLNDDHLKILYYEADSSKMFVNTDIKGGIVVSYRNMLEQYGAIGTFTPYEELNRILCKVKPAIKVPLSTMISGRGVYKLSAAALEEHPEIERIQSKGHKYDVGSGAFKILKDIVFFEEKPVDTNEYVAFLGLVNLKRVYYWTKLKYQNPPKSFAEYKVFIPQASGSGALGEVMSSPLVEAPFVGATETFLSIGGFETRSEAENCLAYIKTKFVRAMLGVLKITQANTREKWKYVPLQDFTAHSDIDWSKSVAEIDRQLYRKYDLTADEINFIETHVKEMA